MSKDDSPRSARKGRTPSVRSFEFAGKSYVLMAKDDFDRLCRLERPRPMTAESIRKDLRVRRHRAGLTLAEVSRRAGIALETLSRIETGRTHPTTTTLSSILRALDQEGRP